MALHFLFMWFFTVNGILYVAYTLISGEWRYLVPRSTTAFRDAWQVMLYDTGLRKQLPPQEKYNAAQQITYTAIVVMGACSVLTGRDIQTRTTRMAGDAIRRLRSCTVHPFCVDNRLFGFLCYSYRASSESWLEKLPIDDHRLRN